MTVENTSAAGAAAPAATPPPAAATPAATPPAQAPAAPETVDPSWLNGRIAKAKASAQAEVLKTLGVDSIDAAKAAVAAAAAVADANKTAETRAAELKAKLDGEVAKAAEQSKIIAEHAGRQMGVLTAEQSEAVKAIAGDDPAAQLRAIAALQPTWAKPADASASSTSAAPVATNTAPGHTAPAAGSATSPPDQRAIYDQLQKQNPFAAADHGLRHSGDVYKPRT